ncbi:MAG: NADPH-dependent assimilatory sulfite reductase hemoprotein subunit [Verrucomicrobia bacterium]|nr:NADPH-dependent assimilatory sulfite reductase hemoprotein subunit [Verrucomicrobiota bacterium]
MINSENNPEAAPVGKPPTRNEGLKENSPTLSGNILSTLNDPNVDRFSEDDYEFLKFHGIYQGDDRDLRKTGKTYQFMIRGRLPGGIVTADQYIAFDDIACRYANNTLRITTRQSFQFHGVVKSGLGPLMKKINDSMCSTIAACGDVNRNVMAAPTPATSPVIELVQQHARDVSNALLPQSKAYHQIWVEGVELNLAEENKTFVDPLYGKTYLPRKFKVAFAIPPLNDVDVFTNDLGFVAIVEGDQLLGYNVIVGGGLGMSHGNAQTYPRVGDLLGFITPEQLIEVSKGVLTVHRDFGDRTNRKHARLKYVIEERGVEWFRNELETRLGYKLETARPYKFTKQGDQYGWHKQLDGKYFLTLFVENGRIKDTETWQLKTALRKVVAEFRPEVRLTPSQNLILTNVQPEQRDGINKLFAEHKIATENQGSAIRLASIACPALPTCGLALSESERVMPEVITRIEGLLAETNLAGEEIVIRMTGCPNGCARPYMAEIAFVGRAPNKYQLYLGGNEASTRLNKLFKENVKNDEIESALRPLFSRYSSERASGERFGDWVERVLWKETVPAQS